MHTKVPGLQHRFVLTRLASYSPALHTEVVTRILTLQHMPLRAVFRRQVTRSYVYKRTYIDKCLYLSALLHRQPTISPAFTDADPV